MTAALTKAARVAVLGVLCTCALPVLADSSMLQARIDVLRPRFADNATLATAQCWLDASRHEALRNDDSGFPQLALDEADALVAGIETGALRPPRDATLRDAAQTLRPDLWAQIARLRAAPTARCDAGLLGCAEVALMHAHHELTQFGWRHANPYVQQAEDRVAAAQAAAAACTPGTR